MSHDVTQEQSESRKECLSQKLTHTLNGSRTVNILSRLGRTINHPLVRDWSGLGRSSLRIKTKWLKRTKPNSNQNKPSCRLIVVFYHVVNDWWINILGPIIFYIKWNRFELDQTGFCSTEYSPLQCCCLLLTNKTWILKSWYCTGHRHRNLILCTSKSRWKFTLGYVCGICVVCVG